MIKPQNKIRSNESLNLSLLNCLHAKKYPRQQLLTTHIPIMKCSIISETFAANVINSHALFFQFWWLVGNLFLKFKVIMVGLAAR